MCIGGLLAGMLAGDAQGAVDALLEGAGEAVSLCLSLAGAYMLWMGLMAVGEEAGLVEKLRRLVEPALKKLFPSSPKAVAPITLNLCANFFGLGSAATPFGLAAMREMQNARPDRLSTTANNSMAMFVVLNTASIQLIPTFMGTLRAQYGSAAPFDILPAVWLASVISVAVGLLTARLLSRLWRS